MLLEIHARIILLTYMNNCFTQTWRPLPQTNDTQSARSPGSLSESWGPSYFHSDIKTPIFALVVLSSSEQSWWCRQHEPPRGARLSEQSFYSSPTCRHSKYNAVSLKNVFGQTVKFVNFRNHSLSAHAILLFCVKRREGCIKHFCCISKMME